MKFFKLIICILFFSPCLVLGQWVSILELPDGNPPQAFADNGNGRLYLANIGQGNRVYSTVNNGLNWSFSNTGITSNLIYDISTQDSFVFISTYNGIFRSTNFGNTFSKLVNDIDSTGSKAIIFDGNNIFAGAGAGSGLGIYKSTNLGNNWVLKNNGLPQYPWVISLAYFGNSIYLGIEGYPGRGIFKSTNSGDNWININNEIPPTSPYSIYTYSNLVLVGTAMGVYISTNSGNNWRLIPEVPGNIGLFGLASIGTQNIFISAWEYGVYVSTNGGLNWVIKNEGLYPDLRLTSLYTLNGYVYVGTNSYQYYPNIFRRPVSELVPVIENNSILPKDYKLFQNYPNPFNPTTTIKYLINQKGFINLSLYNINGEIVKELINKEQTPDSYEINCTFNNQSSGIYYYVLKINDVAVDAKKMVYLK
jgi:hypothetical protein